MLIQYQILTKCQPSVNWLSLILLPRKVRLTYNSLWKKLSMILLGYQGSDQAIITLSDNSSRSPEEEHTRSQPQVTRLLECQEPLLSSSSPSVPLLQLIKDEETHIEQEKVVSFILLPRKVRLTYNPLWKKLSMILLGYQGSDQAIISLSDNSSRSP